MSDSKKKKCARLLSIIGIIALFQSCEESGSAKREEKMSKQPELNETDEYILEVIRKKVWSGFYTADEVDYVIDDILEGDAHENFLRSAVAPEFAKKREAEKGWPETTDCSLLDSAFEALEMRNILCLQNAGYTMSDGHDDASDALAVRSDRNYIGYCFYHGQDLERAVDGGGLMIAFDHVDGDVPDKLAIAIALKEELERVGLALDWDGTVNKRINIPNIDWKRRHKNGG